MHGKSWGEERLKRFSSPAPRALFKPGPLCFSGPGLRVLSTPGPRALFTPRTSSVCLSAESCEFSCLELREVNNPLLGWCLFVPYVFFRHVHEDDPIAFR